MVGSTESDPSFELEPPPPPSPASVFVPPQNQRGGGHARLRVRGWEGPNSDDLRISLALLLLCGWFVGLVMPVQYVEFCPALAALVSPVQNIIFLTEHFSLYYSPTTWAGSRAEAPVSACVSVYTILCIETELVFCRHEQLWKAG